MQVICRKTKGNAEMYCCVCGEGFVVLWERETAAERAVTRCEIQESLRRQHRNAVGPEAHPGDSFSIWEWKGAVLTGAADSLQPALTDL